MVGFLIEADPHVTPLPVHLFYDIASRLGADEMTFYLFTLRWDRISTYLLDD